MQDPPTRRFPKPDGSAPQLRLQGHAASNPEARAALAFLLAAARSDTGRVRWPFDTYRRLVEAVRLTYGSAHTPEATYAHFIKAAHPLTGECRRAKVQVPLTTYFHHAFAYYKALPEASAQPNNQGLRAALTAARPLACHTLVYHGTPWHCFYDPSTHGPLYDALFAELAVQPFVQDQTYSLSAFRYLWTCCRAVAHHPGRFTTLPPYAQVHPPDMAHPPARLLHAIQLVLLLAERGLPASDCPDAFVRCLPLLRADPRDAFVTHFSHIRPNVTNPRNL